MTSQAARIRAGLLATMFGATFGALAPGCGDGGGGDLATLTPRPTELGTPIANINSPEARNKNRGQLITARAVVLVALDNFDETNDGKSIGNVYVQDALQVGPKGTPWSGMQLYRAKKSPPDLALLPGQGLDISGPYKPFAGPLGKEFGKDLEVPQIDTGSVSLVFEGQPPEPVEITLADLKNAAGGLQYQARLVKIRNVTMKGAFDAKYREANISDDRTVVMAAQLFPVDATKGLEVKPGTTFKSVTGVLTYFYSFKLCPRSIDDIER